MLKIRIALLKLKGLTPARIEKLGMLNTKLLRKKRKKQIRNEVLDVLNCAITVAKKGDRIYKTAEYSFNSKLVFRYIRRFSGLNVEIKAVTPRHHLLVITL